MKPSAIISICLIGASSASYAQAPITGNKRFSECINHWVALPGRSPGEPFQFGFIYVDEQAGFTYHLAGSFKIQGDGKLERLPEETFDKKATFKLRLERNGIAAALTEEQVKQLGLPAKPDWLKYYDDGSNSLHHRHRLGFWLNHMGDPTAALSYLESAYKEAPTTGGLPFELSFAYNALGQFDRAIPVLLEAVTRSPKDIFLGSELAYSYLSAGRLKEAVEHYLHFISICPDENERKAEMAMNLSQAYGKLGNQEDSNKWLENAKKWAKEGSTVANYFKQRS